MDRTTKVRSNRSDLQSRVPPRQDPVLVGLIEDHRFMRDRLADLMQRQPGLHVVASAGCTPSGRERLQEARPQVVVIGSATDGTVCHECVRSVRQGLPEARLVVMNVSATREDVILLIEEGANGLLMQNSTVDEFLRTIRLVSGGTNVVPDPLVPLLFAHLAETGPGRPPADGARPHARLTRRERDIGVLIAGGLNNQAMADHLEISLHTVKTHVSTILRKLGLQSRLQIAVHFNRVPAAPPGTNPGTG